MKRVMDAGLAAAAADSAAASISQQCGGHINSDGPVDATFSTAVIAWQRKNGRHQLPWQNTRDAYRIWLSEIMLQQTQVAAVIPYYQRFLLRFPDVASLAAAPAEDVMAHWSGLGYYSRARNLHRCAQRICGEYGGMFPADPALLADLPGIGRSTAAAIAAFAYGRRAAILDGNVKRVFCRVFGIDGYPGERATEQVLWQRAEALLPLPEMTSDDGAGPDSGPIAGVEPTTQLRVRPDIQSPIQSHIQSYTQGLMDLGATLCTRTKPSCTACPLAQRCVALATDRVTQLPVRKLKKPVPERYTAMLIVMDRNQVLLQQRPNHGIWGGLLSLPEFEQSPADASEDQSIDQGACPPKQLMQLLALFGSAAECRRLSSFSHTFTHFRLHVLPYQMTLARRFDLVAQDEHVWYPLEKLAMAPLPAPVKKLLLTLRDEHDAASLPA